MNGSPRNIFLCSAVLPVLVVFLFLFVFATVLLGSAMPLKIVEQKEFSLIGIETRTNNAKEMTNDGVIPRQWARFFADGILAKIPNKAGPTIYAVYTDYASDRNGEYTFFIGAKVSQTEAPPAGMVAKTVPAGKYAVTSSAKGPVQVVVPQAWKQIWSLEDNAQLGGVRSYKADFEVYDQRSRDPQASQVDIHVGIK